MPRTASPPTALIGDAQKGRGQERRLTNQRRRRAKGYSAQPVHAGQSAGLAGGANRLLLTLREGRGRAGLGVDVNFAGKKGFLGA